MPIKNVQVRFGNSQTRIILQNRGPFFATTLTSLRAIKNGLQPWRECPRLAP